MSNKSIKFEKKALPLWLNYYFSVCSRTDRS